MRIQALVLFGASLALGLMAMLAPVSAGDLSNPASLNEKAPATYKVKFDTEQGRVRRRGASRLGAERRRPLLQSRQERLLRRLRASSA